jgi:hypothetical protein
MEPGLVHVWSKLHRNRAVRNGRQRCILVLVAGGILRIRGRVENPDKDAVAAALPAHDPWLECSLSAGVSSRPASWA